MDFSQVTVETHTSETEQYRQLVRCIQEKSDQLFRTLCVYVSRSNLASGRQIELEAKELLNEVVVRALRGAERFDPSRQAMGWLLGIASNIILQEKQRRSLSRRREPFLQDVMLANDHFSLDDMLGRLHPDKSASVEEVLAAREEVKRLMVLLSPEEQQLIKLSVIQQYTANEVAERLGCSAGAARVRLFRALKRLREAASLKDRDDA